MDWPFFLYGLLAVIIALTLSTLELLTRYRSRSLREVFRSQYYLFFALLNSVFCFLVYWALPYLSQGVIKTELSGSVDKGLIRALVAGLSYLVIARMSILDITTKDGTTYGAGFDAIYTGFAEYLLDHHRREMRQRMRKDFENVYMLVSTNQKETFKKAATGVMTGLDAGKDQSDFKNRLDLAEANFANAEPDYCFSIYHLIRDYTTGAEEAKNRIAPGR
jgi:hypothetical protein